MIGMNEMNELLYNNNTGRGKKRGEENCIVIALDI